MEYEYAAILFNGNEKIDLFLFTVPGSFCNVSGQYLKDKISFEI